MDMQKGRSAHKGHGTWVFQPAGKGWSGKEIRETERTVKIDYCQGECLVSPGSSSTAEVDALLTSRVIRSCSRGIGTKVSTSMP